MQVLHLRQRKASQEFLPGAYLVVPAKNLEHAVAIDQQARAGRDLVHSGRVAGLLQAPHSRPLGWTAEPEPVVPGLGD